MYLWLLIKPLFYFIKKLKRKSLYYIKKKFWPHDYMYVLLWLCWHKEKVGTWMHMFVLPTSFFLFVKSFICFAIIISIAVYIHIYLEKKWDQSSYRRSDSFQEKSFERKQTKELYYIFLIYLILDTDFNYQLRLVTVRQRFDINI